MTRSLVDIDAYVRAMQESVGSWDYVLTFGTMFLECVPGVGLAVPGVVVLVVAGFWGASLPLEHGGGLALAAFLGVVLSDCLAFAVGRMGERHVALVRRVLAQHHGLRRTLASQRTGVLLLYQFPPYSRMFAPVLCGATGMSTRRWMVVAIGASAAFVGTFFCLGVGAAWSGRALTQAVDIAGTLIFAGVVGLVWWCAMVYRRLRQRSQQEVA